LFPGILFLILFGFTKGRVERENTGSFPWILFLILFGFSKDREDGSKPIRHHRMNDFVKDEIIPTGLFQAFLEMIVYGVR